MFNLDNLNEDRQKTIQGHSWAKGCIPKSPKSFIELLVQRANRGRFGFELGDSSNGPRLLQSDQHASPTSDIQPNNIEYTVRDLSPFECLTLGLSSPSPLLSISLSLQNSTLWCDENWDTTIETDIHKVSSRK